MQMYFGAAILFLGCDTFFMVHITMMVAMVSRLERRLVDKGLREAFTHATAARWLVEDLVYQTSLMLIGAFVVGLVIML